MIFPQRWAENWVSYWNARDLDALIGLYADTIQLRSPFAKLYASNGLVNGKAALRTYWGEVMRRLPNLRLELTKVYAGHDAIAFVYHDDSGREVIETVTFNDRDEAVLETACVDRPR